MAQPGVISPNAIDTIRSSASKPSQSKFLRNQTSNPFLSPVPLLLPVLLHSIFIPYVLLAYYSYTLQRKMATLFACKAIQGFLQSRGKRSLPLLIQQGQPSSSMESELLVRPLGFRFCTVRPTPETIQLKVRGLKGSKM